MKSVYIDGGYETRNPTWHLEDSAWKAAQVATILRSNAITPKSVVDIGCGVGAVALELSRVMPSAVFTGLDVSPHAVEVANRQSSDRLTFKLIGDGLDDNMFAGQFDVALALDVLEHVEDYFGFLRFVRKFASFTVLHIPLDISVQGVLRASPFLRVRRQVGHLHYFTKETALATVSDAGFHILDYFYTAGSFQLPQKKYGARVGSLPRRIFFRISPDLAARVMGGFSLMVLAHGSEPPSL